MRMRLASSLGRRAGGLSCGEMPITLLPVPGGAKEDGQQFTPVTKEAGSVRSGSAWPCLAYGKEDATSLNSASVSARRVSVLTFPWAPVARSTDAAAAALGAWLMTT